MSECEHEWSSLTLSNEHNEHAVMKYCTVCFRSSFEIDLEKELTQVKAENEKLDSELNRLADEVAVSRIELEQALGYLKRVLDVGLKLSIALDIERFLKRVEDDSK